MKVICRGVWRIGSVVDVVRLRFTIVWKARYVDAFDAIVGASRTSVRCAVDVG